MISKAMAKALNKQINAETYSAYLYLAMSSYASQNGMNGVGNWFLVQAQEEMAHALKFYKYLHSVSAGVELEAVAKPPSNFKSITDLFEQALKHEKKVTAMINRLADMATAQKDHATGALLQWFVQEQVEEEETAADIVGKLKLVGEKGGGLFMIDHKLGARKPGAS